MIQESKDGYFYIMLDGATAGDLRYLLHPDAQVIWLHSHCPDPILHWWKADIPISPGQIWASAEVRLVDYDLMVSLSDFLDRLHLFEPHGMTLTQLTRRVPDSLWARSLSDTEIYRVLKQNGLMSRFYLPHAVETAQFSCVDRSHLERVIAIPEVRRKLLT